MDTLKIRSITVVALVGSVASASALAAILSTGCSSTVGDSEHSVSETTITQENDSSFEAEDAATPDVSSPSVDAGSIDDADAASPDADAEVQPPDTGTPICTADAGVTCTVETTSVSCELPAFADASATVACGQTATVGTACCGGCGCVSVEVYYDGRNCWEGIPQCSQGPIDQFAGQWFDPHAPSP